MTDRRYVQVGYPWAAAFEAGQPQPIEYLTTLIRQTLRYGMPARRYGRPGAWLVRNALPGGLLKTSLRVRRTRARPDVDRLLEDVARSWERLVELSPRLPSSRPSRLSALAMKRRAADTIFVFGPESSPLLVCKIPREESTTLELEVAALNDAGPSGIAPRSLGKVGDAFVQEAVPGAPLEVEGVTPENASGLRWRMEHEMLAEGLTKLAATTVRPGPPQELRSNLKDALEKADVPNDVKAKARLALEDLEGFKIAVLRHGDTSAQNCLFENGRLTGLVDWEIARPQGAPAFDIINAAVALIDHGVGLLNWSEERAVESFRAAWTGSEFMRRAREAARLSTNLAGGSDGDYERLEIAFFARRLASRAAEPDWYATGPRSAAQMLEIACAR